MFRFWFLAAVFFGWVTVAWAVEPNALTSLQQIHSLSNAQASLALPVDFEATVTYCRQNDIDLFVQDRGEAVYVYVPATLRLQAGDRVRIEGKTKDSFRPMIVAERVILLGHGSLPLPLPTSFSQLVRNQFDAMRVTLRATVRTADMVESSTQPNIYLQALMDGGYIDISVNSSDVGALARLIDAEVEVTGVVGAKFDQKIELTGIRISVQDLADIKILHSAATTADALPVSRMEDVLGNYRVLDLSQRVHIRGTITYYQPGANIVLQDGSKSLWVSTLSSQPLHVGDIADVTGFPDVRYGYLGLAHGEVQDTGSRAPIQPLLVGWRELGYGGNAFNLVTIEGRVIRQVREAARDEYVLTADGHVFSAIYRHPLPAFTALTPPIKAIPEGSLVRVTGIGMFYSTDSFNGPIASDLLVQSLDNIQVIAGPSWMTIRNLGILVLFLLALLAATTLRSLFLGRKVLRQTATIAASNETAAVRELLRSRVLEDINASRPLAEILPQIASIVAFRLNGAPCWCELADGNYYGNCPVSMDGLHAVSQTIPSRSGPPFGTLSVAIQQRIKPHPQEEEALGIGVKLATLAVETHRLYADLRHRSEFDQLTNIHNRYSFNLLLEETIETSAQSSTAFALVYIDLDGFKQINDRYGHQIGDLYLQTFAQRIKHQLRSIDILARMGGDEFALLLPEIHSRQQVTDIVQRLEASFLHPLSIEKLSLYVSMSSGIALFPEDGSNRDALIRIADEAMYAVKIYRQMQPADPQSEDPGDAFA